MWYFSQNEFFQFVLCFKILTLLKMYRQITRKEFHAELWKTKSNKFPKVNIERHNISCEKWRKTAVKMFKKIWSWPWKKWDSFVSFIIFVLKATSIKNVKDLLASMYFDLTYYHYNYHHTNLWLFLLLLNFQRNRTNYKMWKFKGFLWTFLVICAPDCLPSE